MKKVTLLVSENQRQEVLQELRRLGTLHIKNIIKPVCEELHSLEETISQVKMAVSILSQQRKHSTEEKINWQAWQIPPKAKEIIIAAREKDEMFRQIHEIEQQFYWFRPWGDFNPQDIQNLKEKGIYIRLYRAPKSDFRKLKERSGIQIINIDKQYFYFAYVSSHPEVYPPFEEIKPPKEGPGALHNKHEQLQRRLARIEYLLDVESRAVGSLREFLLNLESKQGFLNVMHGMKEEEKFGYLQGFCPSAQIKNLVALAKSQSLGYLIEEPSISDEVPTLIDNPRWINIISPVFKFMNTIPGYQEFDISFWFLLFFSLFFAMLVGDAGYGILFIFFTFGGQRKFKKLPKEPFLLMYVLSFATIIWGAMTGCWFGIEKIAKLPLFNALIISQFNAFKDANQDFMIFFCFVIGAVHLTIAHLMRALRIINSLKALAEVGWILTLWGVFFMAGNLVLGKVFPPQAKVILTGGLILLFIFSNFQKNILRGILISLADLPLKIISSFADIVSYLRLFAVGYATIILSITFNDLVLKIGFNNLFAGLASALILFLGHALNVALGLMSVIVHGVRLNLLEFCGHLGMEWSGKEYDPFRESASQQE